MKTLKTFWFILLLSLIFSTGLYGQNEANIWYFGTHCGLDFNSGEPVILYNGMAQWSSACATMSDTSGHLLLYADLYRIYDKHHGHMRYDTLDNIMGAGVYGRAIVKWPGQDGLYYIISPGVQDHINFSYSIVDLKLNDGAGAITECKSSAKSLPVKV